MVSKTKPINKIVKRFKENLHYRVFVVGLLFIVILIMVIVIAFYNVSRKEIEKEVIESNRESMNIASTYFKEQITQYDELLYSILFDETFMHSLKDSGIESLNFSRQNYLVNKLIHTQNVNSNVIDSLSLYTDWNNRRIFLGNDRYVNFDYNNTAEINETHFTNYEDGFKINRRINDFNTRKRIGVVSIYVNWCVMDTAFNLLDADEELVFLSNDDGDIIYRSKNAEKLSASIIETLTDRGHVDQIVESDNHYLFTTKINENLRVNKVIFVNDAFSFSQPLLEAGVLIGIAAVGIYILIIIFFYISIVKPIKNLAKSMRSIEKGQWQIDRNAYSYGERRDEIGKLNKNYIKMITYIERLIETQYKIELTTQKAQFKALQNKINPHFLHNTLQIIGNFALKENGEKVYRLINALSEMFKYTIRTHSNFVALSDELTHIRHYLFIQSERFNKRLAIDFYLDDEISAVKLPILTLQPLIENVFQHGFLKKKDEWHLSIYAEKIFDEVEITITDNGVGMSSTDLEHLRNELSKPKSTHIDASEHIGIGNVNARIKMMYGDQYGISVYSQIEEGFTYIIRVPYKEEC